MKGEYVADHLFNENQAERAYRRAEKKGLIRHYAPALEQAADAPRQYIAVPQNQPMGLVYGRMRRTGHD